MDQVIIGGPSGFSNIFGGQGDDYIIGGTGVFSFMLAYGGDDTVYGGEAFSQVRWRLWYGSDLCRQQRGESVWRGGQ